MAYNAERDMNSENHLGHKMVPSLYAFSPNRMILISHMTYPARQVLFLSSEYY